MRRLHRTLTSAAEIAAYLHRTRMDMLAVLREGPATVSAVAERLGVHPANLTRHMRTLERAGLVALVHKRDTGRNLEKWYASAATTFDVAPDADALKSPHKTALAFARSDLSAALARLPDDRTAAVQVLVVEASLASRQVRAFASEMSRLAERFKAAAGAERGTPHRLVLALYPGGDGGASPQEITLTRPKAGRTRR